MTGPEPTALNVVCVLHGGCSVPPWLAEVARIGQLYLTVNDPKEHEYADAPTEAVLTSNDTPLGFAENVNAALRRVFDDDGRSSACVVNFDLDLSAAALSRLVSTLEGDPSLGAVGARLCGPDDSPIFSAGTIPDPLREFLRAAGLRAGVLFDLQRAVIRRTPGWTARNAVPETGSRVLSSSEYVPWTCLALRREAWSAVGPLDERFPLYAEDIDWSVRCHQTDWRVALADCGRVVHFERATRSPRADALYEYSHLELHRKWGWESNLKWTQRGLRARRRWPLKAVAPALDWSLVTNVDQ